MNKVLQQKRCFLSVFCDHDDVPAYFLSQPDSHVLPHAGCLNGNSASEMTYIVSSGALNSTHSLTHSMAMVSVA